MESVHFRGNLTLRKEMVIHLFFWLLLAYFTFFRIDRSSPSYFSVVRPDLFEVSWFLVFISSFYFIYLLVMPRVFDSFSWERVLVGLLSSYIFFVGIRFLIEEVLLEILFGVSNYLEGTPGIYYLYDNLYYSTFPLIPGVLLWLIVFLIRLLEYNNFIVEENRNTEVKFLKAQLNPHFMFNTLNNIYSLVYFQSEKALPAIEKLSGIMRFTTYESQKEKISLEAEISYFQSYIELEQLRQQGGSFVQVELDIEDLQVQIPPLLLSPLVENALKHGCVTRKEAPVEIHLEQRANRLRFRVFNLIGNKKKDNLGGIGLENLKKRLVIYFPGEHDLRLKQENGTFIAELEIHF